MDDNGSKKQNTASLRAVTVITWLFRIIVGGTFIYSGFVKAVDPWGTVYKFNDYFAVWGLDIWPSLTQVAAFSLFIFEFLVGAFLVLGSFRRAAPVLAALFMAVMLPLTFWIALKNPVADCGCFGDALIISNWATFWKNVVLTAMIVWLLFYNRRVHWLVAPPLQWIAFIASGFFPALTGIIGFYSQPVIDYRPYPVGTALASDESDNDSEEYEPRYVFVYQKDGVTKEVGEDDELPDEADGWTFVSRKELPSQKQAKEGHTFTVWERYGEDETDVTADVILSSGAQLILFIPDMKSTLIASSYKINSFYTWAQQHDIDFIAVVAGTPEETAAWLDLSSARYPIYNADDTQIKEIVRGNPAVVYLEDGKIRWKSTLSALPQDDFLEAPAGLSVLSIPQDFSGTFRNLVYIYLIVNAILIFLSFSPKLGRFVWRRKKHALPDEKNN